MYAKASAVRPCGESVMKYLALQWAEAG